MGAYGGLPELNYRTSLNGFSFIFSKESFEQTDMSLLDELKNILLKNHYHLYVYIYLVKEPHSFCLLDRGKKGKRTGKKYNEQKINLKEFAFVI